MFRNTVLSMEWPTLQEGGVEGQQHGVKSVHQHAMDGRDKPHVSSGVRLGCRHQPVGSGMFRMAKCNSF